MVGKAVRPNSSVGVCPRYRDKPSSVNCDNLDRLATTKILSASVSRTNANTFGFPDGKASKLPLPKVGYCFLKSRIRRVHHSKELGLECWLSTLRSS